MREIEGLKGSLSSEHEGTKWKWGGAGLANGQKRKEGRSMITDNAQLPEEPWMNDFQKGGGTMGHTH